MMVVYGLAMPFQEWAGVNAYTSTGGRNQIIRTARTTAPADARTTSRRRVTAGRLAVWGTPVNLTDGPSPKKIRTGPVARTRPVGMPLSSW